MSGKNADRLWLPERLTRRDALKVSGGLALAAGLSACGVGNGAGTTGDTARKIEPKVDGDLVYFNYAQYVDPGLVKKFESKYNVTVRESYYDSMPAMMAKLNSGNQYDVFFPSAEFAHKLVGANQLIEIPRDKVPAASDIYSFFDNPWYDPGSKHTLPVLALPDWPRLPRRQDRHDERLLAGHHQPASRRPLVRPRRLPGGHRDGEPGQRLRPQHDRGGPAQQDQGLPGRPEAASARIQHRHDHQHVLGRRLDPAPVERRHHQHPLPGRRPKLDPVPEERGGRADRQ